MTENQDVYLLLGQLDGKMDRLIEEQVRLEKTLFRNQERLNKLERDRAIMYGAAAVLAFIGSGVMWIISHFIKGM
jgi:hypothetical protein